MWTIAGGIFLFCGICALVGLAITVIGVVGQWFQERGWQKKPAPDYKRLAQQAEAARNDYRTSYLDEL